MSLIDTILGRQNVQQLPTDQQDQARSEAYRQFILGSLFGGRGLASGYAATQEVIPNMRAAQQRQRLIQAQESAMVPTAVKPGSQIDLIQKQTGEEQLDAGTLEALQRNAGGRGLQGTGLTEGQQFLRQFDPTLYAQNVTAAMDPTKPKDILDVRASAAPKFDSATGLFTDPFTGQIRSSVERPGTAPGTAVRIGSTGEMSVRALPGAAQAAETARPIDLAQGEVVIGYDLQGLPIVQNARGVIQSRFEREGATAQGQAMGQVERVFDPATGTERLVPRSVITGGPVATPSPRIGQPGAAQQPPSQTGAPGVPAQGQPTGAPQPRPAVGFQAGQSVNERILTEAAGGAFIKKRADIQDRATNAASRRFQAERTYDTVSRLDPTALTQLGAAVVPFIRAVPGFRDATEQFAVDTSLIKQQWAGGVLGNFGLAKGNLNEKEVNLVEQANWDAFGPRTATRYVVTIEAALANKDAAKNQFAEEFVANGGDFRKFESEWAKSPLNTPIFNDPMMNRFINDEVTEALQRGVQPTLPPGFRVVGQSRSTGRPIIEKPDGTRMQVGR
jgi:hypothetical protein